MSKFYLWGKVAIATTQPHNNTVSLNKIVKLVKYTTHLSTFDIKITDYINFPKLLL